MEEINDDPSFAERRSISRCACQDESVSEESTPDMTCFCPKDENDLVKHTEECIFHRNQNLIFPDDPQLCVCEDDEKICKCCQCPLSKCYCAKVTKEDYESWRKNQPMTGLPGVMDANHPLMQKFQQTLKLFLEKENQVAKEELEILRDDLRLAKSKYDADLESIYLSDHDTDTQRVMIEEYESNIEKLTAERQQAQEKARITAIEFDEAKNKLENCVRTEKEYMHEMEALTLLCKQLQDWKKETDIETTVTNRISEKIKQEHATRAAQKRHLDMIVYGLSSEVWKLEANIELMKKQIEIKNAEIDKVNNKVIANIAELEDLDLDKRRLVSLWNAVIVNIKQRDKVYYSVSHDYKNLQDNYQTLLLNRDITKKTIMEEMNVGKEIMMLKEKYDYDYNKTLKAYEEEDAKRIMHESKIIEVSDAIEMCDHDQELIKEENTTIRYKLSQTATRVDKMIQKKLQIENEILSNIQDLLLNNKAFGSMVKGIKKLREMSRKQEIALSITENQHAKVMLEIETYRYKQLINEKVLSKTEKTVREKEKEIDELERKYDGKTQLMIKMQRDLDSITQKYFELKEVFGTSVQGKRISDLESEIYRMRERTAELQQEWLRLQIIVVGHASQHHALTKDVHLIKKQIDICTQKALRIENVSNQLTAECHQIEKSLRNLRAKLENLERTRYEAQHRNKEVIYSTNAFTYTNIANLKDAELGVLQLEQEIEDYEKEKDELIQGLDRVQREALIWQRKGILALELKKNMKDSKSAVGEVGQMKNEIHRMENRREQMRRFAERLSDDLANVISNREAALAKSRAHLALQKRNHGSSNSQSQYQYKLKLAKADMTRVAKVLKDTEERYNYLQQQQERIENETAKVIKQNAQIEEEIAKLNEEGIDADKTKQLLLERVARTQRLATEIGKAVKRQSLKLRKPRQQLSSEYEQNIILNERLRNVVEVLQNSYPYLEAQLEKIANTLNIRLPNISLKLLTQDCLCGLETCECVRYGCYCPRLEAAEDDVPERDVPRNIEIIEEGVTDLTMLAEDKDVRYSSACDEQCLHKLSIGDNGE